MKTGIIGWAMGVALAFVSAGLGFGAPPLDQPPKTQPPKKEAVVWVVVEVKNLKGDISYEAMQVKQLKDRIDRAHKDYLATLDAWKKAKAGAAKAGKKFDDKQPVEGWVKRIGDSTIYRTEAEAKAAAQKLADALEARKKAAEGNKTGTTDTVKPVAHTPPTGQVIKPADPDTTDTGDKNP